MAYQAVIFDLDGTILDTVEDLAAAVNYALSKKGFAPLDAQGVASRVGNGIKNLIERSLPEGSEPALVEECLASFREYYFTHLDVHTHPYEGIMEMMQNLIAAGVKLGVVSNKVESATVQLCKKFFPQMLDCVVGERADVKRKPAPYPLLLAARELNVAPERALYIGDSPNDLVAAQAAGMGAGCVTWGYRSREQLMEKNPDHLFERPAEILFGALMF